MSLETQKDSTAAQIQNRLAEIEVEQTACQQATEDAQAQFGDAVLGGDADKIAQASERVAACRQDEIRLQAGEEALRRRLRAAREREAAEAHAKAWDAYEKALEARHVAFERAEKVAGPFFEAVEAAIDAVREVWRVQPINGRILTDDGWVLMGNSFEGVANLRAGELREVRGALADMVARSRSEAEEKLRVREFHTPEMMES